MKKLNAKGVGTRKMVFLLNRRMFATEIDIAFPTCVLYKIGKDWPSISLEDVYERRSTTSKNG